MRARLAVFGLCLVGCYTSATGEFAEFGGGETVGEVGGESSSGAGEATGGEATGGSSLTGAAATTGDASVSVGEASDGGEASGGGESTGVDATSGGELTTGGDDTTTGGPPADCPRVRVLTPGDVANVRPEPSTAMDPVGTLADGSIVDVLGVVQGEAIEGDPTWFHVQSPSVTGYVWGGLLECTTDEPFDGMFYLPLECGKQATISQGNNGDFSHNGQSAYAFDFSLGIGTPLVAVADGTVLKAYGGTLPGDPCYDGGGMECINAANYVSLVHSDGTQSIYAHLSEVEVADGQFVPRGAIVGLTGSSGWSTGPHAHVARSQGCGSRWCQSIEMKFADVGGDGIPDTGEQVVSGNCP
jgi:hypothetical protein